ncbi:hypothetical protein L0156_17605 [bacterium]|nr:hypothetical protein [bacterium]
MSFHLRKQLRSLRSVLPFSIIAAFFFTLLTQDLSPEYFSVISITATGDKAKDSKAPVVWMAHPDVAELMRHGFHVEKSAGWEIHQGIFISTRNQPAELRLTGHSRKTIRLEFSQTPYSGRMECEVNGKKRNFDLFRDDPSTEMVPLIDGTTEKKSSLLPALSTFVKHFSKNALLLILFSTALYPIYRRMPSARFIPPTVSFRIEKRRKYRMIAIVFIFGIFVWGFYPGVMTDDSVDQYAQAVRFEFNDWHPPILAALWSITNRIVEGPGGMFLLHTGMLCFSTFLLSLVAAIKGKKNFFLPLLAVLLPVVSCIFFYIIKDVSFAFSLLLAFSLWYFWRTTGKLNKLGLLFILVLVFYAASARLNSVTAVVPLLFLFLLCFTSKRNAAFCSLVTAALFFLGSSYLTYNILMARRSYVFQVIMAHDLMSIYDITGRNYFPENYLTKERLDQLMKKFSKLDSNATTWIEQPFLSTDSQVASQLKNQWVRAILEEPKAYLLHRWTVFKYFLLAVDPWLYNYQEPASWNSSRRPLLMGEDFPAKVYLKYGDWVRGNVSLAFQTVTYLITSLSILIFSIRKRIMAAGALSLSALLYLFSYFFVAPGADYRYTYWPVCSALITLFVMWVENEPHDSKMK